MLEILALFFIGRSIADTARRKGRSAMWALLLIPLWFGAEVFGAVIGVLLDLGIGTYLLAFGFAGCGGFLAWFVVNALPVRAGFDPLEAGDGSALGLECPNCGSVQTELMGNQIMCYACDQVSARA